MARIVVGMSGGVDSAVTAYLLKSAGHDVIGVTLKTWLNEQGEISRCCEIDDARRTADMLDIPYYTINCAQSFQKMVKEPFINSYINGMTPNPCIGCNRDIKWSGMLSFADSMNAGYVATGHYASVVKHQNGRFSVKKADFADKDQTYMLYRLTQSQLSRTIMPLGRLSKEQVRSIAERIGLGVANNPDSQEVCFVSSGSYRDYIEQNCENYIPQEGDFVDENGNVLGRHKGIINYTVGQRKGLGLSMGIPVFVKRIDAENNRIVISSSEALFSSVVYCDELCFQSIEDIMQSERIEANVKIRYRHEGAGAFIERAGSDKVKITFTSPVRAPTPGQSAVFYDGKGCIIGGGKICRE